MQAIAKDPLVAKERVLGAGLLMIAGLLLPLTSITKSSRPTPETATDPSPMMPSLRPTPRHRTMSWPPRSQGKSPL